MEKKKYWVRSGEKVIEWYDRIGPAIERALHIWQWDRANGHQFTQITVGMGEKGSRRTLWWNGRDISEAQHIKKKDEREYKVPEKEFDFDS